jgi:hypothetical protein
LLTRAGMQCCEKYGAEDELCLRAYTWLEIAADVLASVHAACKQSGEQNERDTIGY